VIHIVQGSINRGMYANKSRKRNKSRVAKRMFTSIVLAPGKMPRIAGEKADRIMRSCEIVSLVFVTMLMLHIILPEIVSVIFVIASGSVFGFLMLLILLGNYQSKLVEYELYGFRL